MGGMRYGKPLESAVEKYFVAQVEKHLGWQARKWTTRRGDPDRICLIPGGKVLFVELKRPGEKPRPEQLREHERLTAMGFEVFVIDSKVGVDEFINLMEGRKCV